MQLYPLLSQLILTKIVNIPASTLGAQLQTEQFRILNIKAEGAKTEVPQGTLAALKNIDYVSADLVPEGGIHKEETRERLVRFLELGSLR
jgi:hypothetical protein